MNKKSWMIFAIIVVAIVGGMIYISTQNRLNVSDINNDQLNTIIGAESRNGDIDLQITKLAAKALKLQLSNTPIINALAVALPHQRLKR